MARLPGLIILLWSVLPGMTATFGRVVPLVGGAADVVLDETRSRVYLTSTLQNAVQIYSTQQQRFLTPITTDQTPLSAALSRDRKSLYVTCFDSSAIDVIDLDALSVSKRVALPAKPEGIAVARDGRVLISTTGSGTGSTANVLLLYDPSPGASPVLTSIPVTLPAPTAPTLPPPSGRPFLATHSQLVATRDGSFIVGVNASTGTPTLFLYESSSATVLRARTNIAGSSTTVAISDDGTRILCGPNLFDTSTFQVLAQENLANFPFALGTTTNFNLQANQGGAVFSPDGQTLYAAFTVASAAGAAASSALLLSDPDNLLVRTGLQLPESLAGKMVISADAANVYALSDSGFAIVPLSTISQSALALPSAGVVLLTRDPCGVTSQNATVTLPVDNPGRGRITVTAQLLQIAGQPNQASPATAPTARSSATATGAQLVFSFNATAARAIGTITPPHDFAINSPEAINFPNRVRVFQNSHDSEARGTIIPLGSGTGAGEQFPDLAFDQARQRVYIANAGLNRIDIYDARQQKLLTPIKAGQLPSSIALTPDGATLYVANSGGESISVIDPDKLQVIGSIQFPPIPFNSNLALVTPRVIAAGLSGLQILMSDGSLWKVVGSTAVPRGVSKAIGQNAQGRPAAIPIPSSMAATPGGEYILLATGTGIAYLYDATVDDFVTGRQVTATPTGYVGPVAAGPRGQYFVMNGTLLNSVLVPAVSAPGRPVSAVAAVSNTSLAIFSPPPAGAANALPSAAPIVQLLDPTTGLGGVSVNALEGPIIQAAITGRTNISGRTMAVDAANAVAYVITASGLSIIPVTPVAAADRPQPANRGAVNLASYQLPVAANGLLSIFGQNLGASAVAGTTPLPLVLGGTCVTLNNIALPLFATSPGQINAQIPPDLAPGTYPLIVRAIGKGAASVSQQLTVSKYGPAVVVSSDGQIALFHADGKPVTHDNPANRDEPLTLYAVGLGPTTGGAVVAGTPSPSSPLAQTGDVKLYFGDPSYVQAEIIVDWSGLAPGWVGLYQLNIRVPGFHIKGDSLPVMIETGTVKSPTSGPVVPTVSVD